MSTTTAQPKIRLMPLGALDDRHLDRWRALQATNPDLQSPFFAPEFALGFQRQGHLVQVAVIEHNSEIAAFFPFERGGLARAGAQDQAMRLLGAGCPAGRRLSDSHGLISAPGFTFDAQKLLAACRLNAWDFHRLAPNQPTFSQYQTGRQDWHIIDLRLGYAAYLAGITTTSTDVLKQTAMKARRLVRAAGPLSFKSNLNDPKLLSTLLTWRYARHPEADEIDGLRPDALKALLTHFLSVQTAALSGRLSALYAGDQIAALHFGLVSPDVLVYWFLSFNPAFANYSPGIILLLRLIEQAGHDGIKQIDLGAGTERYKQQLHSRTIPLLAGSVVRPSALALYRRIKGRLVRYDPHVEPAPV